MEFKSGKDSIGQKYFSQNYNRVVEEREIELEREVWRIKEILVKGKNESESVLVHSLRALQWIEISHDISKATMIGKPVSALTKHGSEQIRVLARALVLKWKRMIDVWIATQEEQKLDVKENEKLDPPSKKHALATQENMLNSIDYETRLDAIGKRLRDNYQQAENDPSTAKKQRKIKVIELKNLRTQAVGQMHVEKNGVPKKKTLKYTQPKSLRKNGRSSGYLVF